MIEDQERHSDPVDAGSAIAETWLSDKLADHRRQSEKLYRDIEAEICNGCNYATKAAWGKTCDGWSECRSDLDRKESAEKRMGKRCD